MKILHLFGDWKWTGPAEPTMDLCLALREEGLDVRLAANTPPPGVNTSVADAARERGLDLITDFHFGRFPWPSQVRKISDYIDHEKIDIVHTHITHDHIYGGPASRRSKRRPAVIRTNERAAPISNHFGSRLLFSKWTDGYITYSASALEADRAAFGLNRRAWQIAPAMRLDRLDPAAPPARADYGIGDDQFVIGVVARMQRHRRFEILLEGVKQARVPGLRVLIVGRGTNQKEVAVEPAKRLGLDAVVTFTGYVKEKYQNVVAAFDALLFLMPGSDGTCRAIREAMVMGRAVIGAHRGMIPELVEDGKTGLVVEDSAENIARAIETLAGDRELTRRMGAAARGKALATFDVKKQAAQVISIYEEILKNR